MSWLPFIDMQLPVIKIEGESSLISELSCYMCVFVFIDPDQTQLYKCDNEQYFFSLCVSLRLQSLNNAEH